MARRGVGHGAPARGGEAVFCHLALANQGGSNIYPNRGDNIYDGTSWDGRGVTVGIQVKKRRRPSTCQLVRGRPGGPWEIGITLAKRRSGPMRPDPADMGMECRGRRGFGGGVEPNLPLVVLALLAPGRERAAQAHHRPKGCAAESVEGAGG